MKKTYIIAEMACSHEGKPELARLIIDGAGRAGADAVQFQIWKAGDMVVPHHPDFPLLQRIELSRDSWRGLSDHVRGNYPDMEIIACIYEERSADFALEMGADAFKIHSADLSNPRLIRHVAGMNKRIDLSVGASTLDEIRSALQWIRDVSKADIWLMYGYQSFPTPTDAIHLNYMITLRDTFALPVGYQDHSDAETEAAFWLPAATVGMDVEILEKNITHDRSLKGIDHQAALNPGEFLSFVAMAREIEAAKGSALSRPFSPEEIRYRKYSKKSIVAARDLAAGTVLCENDLLFLRPVDLGLPPDRADLLVGKALRTDLKRFDLVAADDVHGIR